MTIRNVLCGGHIAPAETQWVAVMAKRVNPCEVLRTVPATECALVMFFPVNLREEDGKRDDLPFQPSTGVEVGVGGEFRAGSWGAWGLLLPLPLSVGGLWVHLSGPEFPYL